jgi:hypothetical protein
MYQVTGGCRRKMTPSGSVTSVKAGITKQLVVRYAGRNDPYRGLVEAGRRSAGPRPG